MIEKVADGEQPASKSTVSFPHQPHVVGASLACNECHEVTKDGRDIATRPEAVACNQCHDHVDDGPDDSNYEGLFNGGAKSCVRCHQQLRDPGAEPMLAVPSIRGSAAAASDSRYRATQDVFAGFAQSQFHPAGSECSDCHRANLASGSDGELRAIQLPVGDHLFATRSGSVHAPPGSTGEPAECLRCHWTPVNNLDTAVRSAPAGTPAERAFRRAPMSERTRREYGNEFEGYPGTERARG